MCRGLFAQDIFSVFGAIEEVIVIALGFDVM